MSVQVNNKNNPNTKLKHSIMALLVKKHLMLKGFNFFHS